MAFSGVLRNNVLVQKGGAQCVYKAELQEWPWFQFWIRHVDGMKGDASSVRGRGKGKPQKMTNI